MSNIKTQTLPLTEAEKPLVFAETFDDARTFGDQLKYYEVTGTTPSDKPKYKAINETKYALSAKVPKFPPAVLASVLASCLYDLTKKRFKVSTYAEFSNVVLFMVEKDAKLGVDAPAGDFQLPDVHGDTDFTLWTVISGHVLSPLSGIQETPTGHVTKPVNRNLGKIMYKLCERFMKKMKHLGEDQHTLHKDLLLAPLGKNY